MSDLEARGTDLGESLAEGDAKTMGQDAINDQIGKNSLFPSLTLKKRVIGFAILACVGIICGLLSSSVLITSLTSAFKFAIPFTISTICLVVSTFFFVGPMSQIKTMFHKTRWITSLVLLIAFGMTLISGLFIQEGWMVLIFVVIEIGAFIWYTLSYIPYARTTIINFVKRGCKKS
ncbi:unnamed protein product [Moneuplotes crassus]|uniref:Vesicle transport protein n=1 Tax=Euplotes crassus TaxID=5936 RepID=A0AAD1Y286_EUPCR|nr:unnamed protein product [Moneuplotes crassus]